MSSFVQLQHLSTIDAGGTSGLWRREDFPLEVGIKITKRTCLPAQCYLTLTVALCRQEWDLQGTKAWCWTRGSPAPTLDLLGRELWRRVPMEFGPVKSTSILPCWRGCIIIWNMWRLARPVSLPAIMVSVCHLVDKIEVREIPMVSGY